MAVQKALEPRRLLWTACIVAVLALVAAAALALRARPLPPGRLLVAMADTENATGDPDLDGVSELLGMGLEQSRRVSLLARSRIVNAIREAGERVPRAIGEVEARSAARKAQAQVLVVPAVRRSGSGYDVAVRAADVARDETLFSLRESAAAKATIPAALDRLTKRVRSALQEDPGEAPKRAVTAIEIAPVDPAALRLYTEGKRLESESRFDEARRAYEAAIAAAPEFLPPRVELLQGSLWGWIEGIAPREVEEHRGVLRENLQRLPEKERMYVETFLGEFGNSTDLLAALDRAIEAWPEDPRPYVQAAGILFEDRGDLEAARPYIEKALVLAPLAVDVTIDHLIALGRLDEALARARRWTVESPSSVSFMNLSEVHRVRGELPEALEAARRGPNFRTFVDADALEEGEAAWKPDPDPKKGPFSPWVRWLTLRGRIRDAIAEVDGQALGPEAPARARAHDFWRSFLLAHRGDPEPLRQSWAEVVRHGRLLPPCTLWPLAFLGDPERAATMALGWPSDHKPCLRIVQALATWKRGDREAALGAFARIHLATTQAYRGEILWELGRDREAIESFRAYRRLRGASWTDISLDPWHYPRSLYFEAMALERLGERAQALAVADRLLHLWARADPGLPLLAEAKALRARLAGTVPLAPAP